jgi:hypothetical protein
VLQAWLRTSQNYFLAKFAFLAFYELRLLGILRSSHTRSSQKFDPYEKRARNCR